MAIQRNPVSKPHHPPKQTSLELEWPSTKGSVWGQRRLLRRERAKGDQVDSQQHFKNRGVALLGPCLQHPSKLAVQETCTYLRLLHQCSGASRV